MKKPINTFDDLVKPNVNRLVDRFEDREQPTPIANRLADRFEDREQPTPTGLNTSSDWGARNFVDLNMKVSDRIRAKHWKEAAHRGISSKRLYLMAMQAFYEKHGSLVERFEPESIGIEQDEIDRGR